MENMLSGVSVSVMSVCDLIFNSKVRTDYILTSGIMNTLFSGGTYCQ